MCQLLERWKSKSLTVELQGPTCQFFEIALEDSAACSAAFRTGSGRPGSGSPSALGRGSRNPKPPLECFLCSPDYKLLDISAKDNMVFFEEYEDMIRHLLWYDIVARCSDPLWRYLGVIGWDRNLWFAESKRAVRNLPQNRGQRSPPPDSGTRLQVLKLCLLAGLSQSWSGGYTTKKKQSQSHLTLSRGMKQIEIMSPNQRHCQKSLRGAPASKMTIKINQHLSETDSTS